MIMMKINGNQHKAKDDIDAAIERAVNGQFFDLSCPSSLILSTSITLVTSSTLSAIPMGPQNIPSR